MRSRTHYRYPLTSCRARRRHSASANACVHSRAVAKVRPVSDVVKRRAARLDIEV